VIFRYVACLSCRIFSAGVNRTAFGGFSFLIERRLIMASEVKFEPEFRDRAVRLYLERRAGHQEESLAASVRQVAAVLGMSVDTSWGSRRAAEVDAGKRPGITSDMAAELRKPRRENAEWRRANEILKTASAFFAAELDRPRL
jgi:transposase